MRCESRLDCPGLWLTGASGSGPRLPACVSVCVCLLVVGRSTRRQAGSSKALSGPGALISLPKAVEPS